MPLIEYRVGIVRVLNRIGPRSIIEHVTEHNGRSSALDSASQQQKRVLVTVDGSQQSLRALDYAVSIYSSIMFHDKVMIIILNVIEWADIVGESMDDELAAEIEEQGRRMLEAL